ncbi:MAG: EamA family transporter [Devosia sp.]|nr:EamA family transporter [Devosia sp.]
MSTNSSSADNSYLWPGVPLALASALLFGASAPLSKLLLGSVHPGLLAGILYLGAGLGLAIVHFGRRGFGIAQLEAPLARRDLPWLLLVILFGGVLAPLFLMLGLSMTTASTGSLLLNLESLATMLIAWVVFRENVDRRLILGAFAILAGAILLTWSGGSVSLDLGALFIAAACLGWGIDNNLTRKLSSADPVQIAMLKGLVAGTVNVTLAFAIGASLPSLPVVAGGALVGFFGIGVSLVMFMLGLRHLGTARTGAYYSLAPFIGAVLAIAFLGDPITLNLLLAAGLMGLGLWLHLTERHEHQHVHDTIEHEHRHVHDEHHQHDHDGSLTEPHSHAHRHEPIAHSHPHYPDLHHRHGHKHE